MSKSNSEVSRPVGRPSWYDESKQKKYFSLTPTAIRLLEHFADLNDCPSLSEALETVLRDYLADAELKKYHLLRIEPESLELLMNYSTRKHFAKYQERCEFEEDKRDGAYGQFYKLNQVLNILIHECLSDDPLFVELDRKRIEILERFRIENEFSSFNEVLTELIEC